MKNVETHQDTDGPLTWMRKLVIPWLQCEEWQPQQLIDWLQGYGLPPVGHEDSPYQWILRGLPLGAERHRAEQTLALRAAQLLDGQPDVKPVGTRPNEVLYNLLYLCAGLSCPDQLAEPLYAIFRRNKLSGQWFGEDLRSCLRSALIENQIDSRLKVVWEAHLANQQHEFFPNTTPYTGFTAILVMPESENTRGKPYLDAIGRALGMMAVYFELKYRESDRKVKFLELIEQIKRTYEEVSNWDRKFYKLASIYDWPQWSIRLLPIYIEVEDSEVEGSYDGTLALMNREFFEHARDTYSIYEKNINANYESFKAFTHISCELLTLACIPNVQLAISFAKLSSKFFECQKDMPYQLTLKKGLATTFTNYIENDSKDKESARILKPMHIDTLNKILLPTPHS